MKKILLTVFVVVLISACLGAEEVYKIKFAGTDVNFRADLKKADKTSVEPGPEAIRQVMFENPVSLLRIAFLAEDNYTSFYGVTGFELQYKTVLAYKQFIFTDDAVTSSEDGANCIYFQKRVGIVATERKICFSSLILNSTEEAAALANETAPIIFMQGGSEETKVSVDGSLITISGKDMTQNGRKYTDLDLAADKFLLVLMNESTKR